MNLMSGCKNKGTTDLEGDRTYANDFNKVYAQFDCNDFGKEREDRLSLLSEKIKNRDESERIPGIRERSASESIEYESRQNPRARLCIT